MDYDDIRIFSFIREIFGMCIIYILCEAFYPGRRKKIKLNFYFHTFLWCLKRSYEDLKGLYRTFWIQPFQYNFQKCREQEGLIGKYLCVLFTLCVRHFTIYGEWRGIRHVIWKLRAMSHAYLRPYLRWEILVEFWYLSASLRSMYPFHIP